MRQVIEPQMQIGEQAIGAIWLDPKSREDLPPNLRGLEPLDTTPEVRERVLAILEEGRPIRESEEENALVAPDAGRPGMSQWKILALNADYDRIRALVHEHSTSRQFLGHSDWNDRYPKQPLRDKRRLFTPERLDRSHQEGVRAGPKALKKSPDEGRAGRCDSFVVETDVPFPTDIHLLLEALRKVIELAERHALPLVR